MHIRKISDEGDAPGDSMTEKVSLEEKLSLFADYFAPRTVAQFNGHDVMLAKLKGPFIWHIHEDADDFFLVITGVLDIELRDRTITLGPGEMYVVPKGLEHRPLARDEVHLLLIEPSGTANTGDAATAAPRQFI
jgi:mannose-6-phosphate isomerase-like protein (cupin superfamily)